MKIMMFVDGKYYSGTPIAIVEKFRDKASDHFETKDTADYLDQLASPYGLGEQFLGDNLDKRCRALIDHLVERKLASIVAP